MVDRSLNTTFTIDNDPLWHQLKSVPAFRALLRAVEARFYRNLDLPQPVLDIGCGDGHFSQAVFNISPQAGVDLDLNALFKSSKHRAYDLSLQATTIDLPFRDGSFGSAFSNSALEHISEIQPALNEINRVLAPKAPFAITVPSHNFTAYLSGARFLDRLGFANLSANYRNLFNRISRHTHTDSPEVWASRLAQAGFAIERWQYYFSQDAMRAFEIGHFASIPSAVIHALTGHWILGPWESNLKWTERWARPYYQEEFPKEGAYIFILARKKSALPIEIPLPPANPFTLEELLGSEKSVRSDEEAQDDSSTPQTYSELPDTLNGPEIDSEADEAAVNWQPFIIGALAILALLFALFGQSRLKAGLDQPGTGLGWVGLSALMLILLAWYRKPVRSSGQSFHLPSLSNVPQRRWLILLAFFIALIAPRFVTGSGQHRPGIAIITWLAAIGIAIFALSAELSSSELDLDKKHTNLRLDIFIGFTLFLVALLPRLYQLASHPFVLNGSEASIGLDVLNIIQGTSRNPFGTSWLTNPTLPLYLMAVPIKLLGPSTFSLRLLSSIIGAVTVAAVFLIGRRLYGLTTGLVAAVLLLGSHFHVHYSRLGLTNVWDALMILLALGLIAIAWQQEQEHSRSTWLLAGLATGLNAYLFTSSHLLPVILLILMITTLLFERQNWRLHWRNVLAMSALALVVALPQILHYQANPNLFMERANTVGILDSQGGWLSREAARTGISQAELLVGQIWRAALGFNASLDRGTYYAPFSPLLNFAAGVLTVLGFILALLRYRELRFSMLVVWITATIVFAGALIENPPSSHRYIIAAPAVMIVAALALVELVGTLLAASTNSHDVERSRSWLHSNRIHLLIPLLIAIVIGLYDITYYFGVYKTEHHFADRNTEVANDMANYLNSLNDDWSAYFFGPPSMYVGFSTIPFLVKDFSEGVNLFDILEPGSPLPSTDSQNLTFIYLPERYSELENTKMSYPDGQEQAVAGYYADPLFYIYEVRQHRR